jgi:hypothetical protein
MLKEIIGNDNAPGTQAMLDGLIEIDGVPTDDGGANKAQPKGSVGVDRPGSGANLGFCRAYSCAGI